jgi:hypothetical protein
MTSEEERRRHVGDGLSLVTQFTWDLTARRYMYTFQMAHAYKGRTLDFTADDPRPPISAVR